MFSQYLTRGSFMLSTAVCLASPMSAQTIVDVTSADTLAAALSSATPGTVINLAGGDYGDLTLKNTGGAADQPITLRSADPAAPAQFDTMALRGVQHLVLEGLTFDYRFGPEDRSNLRMFQISESRDITLRNNLFDGDMAQGISDEKDGYPNGFGLSLRDVKGAVIEGNEIRNFYRAMVTSQSSDLLIKANDVHGIRSDGMDFAEVVRVRIEGNQIHDFNRALEATDHADMIQFWTNGTKTPSTDITIRGNILNSGAGWYTQSIFMRNDVVDTGKGGPEMFYRNITIEDNVIINAHLHGITVGETAGLRIMNNSVIRNARSQGKDDNPGLWTPQIRVAPTSTEVVIAKNVTSKITGYDTQADWSVADNYLIQDRFPAQQGFYDQVFVAARSGDPTNLASFAYLSGGPLDGVGVGAPQLDPASADLPAEAKARPVIRVVADAAHSNRFRFEAGASALPEGVAADQIGYAWDLGDGSTATEAAVDHVFAETGPHQITLTLTLPDGSTVQAQSQINVPGPDVLEFSSETGAFTSYAGRDPIEVPNLSLVKGPAILGQGVSPIVIPAGMIAPFFQSEDFQLRLRMRGAAGYKSAGELLRIHQTLLVNVTERGSLNVRFDTATAAQLKITTRGLKLFSPQWHDIVFSYSAKTGLFRVTADGVEIGSGITHGIIRPLEHWGLALGNPFANRKSFDGELESLSLRVNEAAFYKMQ